MDTTSIARRRKLAEALLAQGQTQAQGQMVSGHYVAPSPLQGAANLFSTYLGKKQSDTADTEERTYQDKQRQAYAAFLRGDPAALDGSPELMDTLGPIMAKSKIDSQAKQQELKNKTEHFDAGDHIEVRNGLGEIISTIPKGNSPDAVLREQGEQGRFNGVSGSAALTAQTQREAIAQRAAALGASRLPAGYQQSANGGLEFIPGGPADPAKAKRAAPTEFQGKSAVFGARAEAADKILNDLEGKYSPVAVASKKALDSIPNLLGGGMIRSGANAISSDNTQSIEQAQRDFINAVLRQESGASISPAEFENASKQYFPQPGDSANTIKQKAANRKIVIEGFKRNASQAAFEPEGQAPAPAGQVIDWSDLP